MYLNLDLARGIAALGVFLFHINGILEKSMPTLAKITQYGSLGVPLFFVISGYVITSSAESVISKNRSSYSFLKRRFLRIFPPFWFSILVVISIPYIVAAISSLKTGQYNPPEPRYFELSHADWIQVITLTKVFMSESKDLQNQFNQINSVYWTLAIEFQFYLSVYVALLFRRHFHSILFSITTISIVLIVFPFQLNNGLFMHFWPMFAAGIITYYIIAHGLTIERIFPRSGRIIAAMLVIFSIGCIAILAYLGILKSFLYSSFPSYSLSFALFSAFVLWLSAPLESILEGANSGQNFISRSIVKSGAFLGVISYSLYLLHGKVAEIPAMLARQIVPMDSASYPILMVGGTIALCSVFHFYIEKPFMSKKQRELYHSMLIG